MKNVNQARNSLSLRNLQGVPFYDFLEQNIGWLRWVIVFIIYLIAVLLGFLSSEINPIYVIAGSILVLGGLLAIAFYKKTDLIPILLLGSALFVPFTVPTGAGSNLAFSMVVVVMFFGLWLLHSMTVDRRISVKASPVNFPIFIFMFVTLFSVAWSILFRDPFVYVWEKFTIAQIVASLVIVFLPMAFLMVVNFVNSSHPFIIMSLMMIIAGVAGLVKNYLGVNLPVDVRGLFSLWVIGLSFGFVLFIRKLHWSIKLFLLLLTAGWIHYTFFKNITWIAGWFPPLVSIGVLVWMRSKKLLIVFAIFMLGLIASNYDYYVGRVIENEKEESGYSRVEAWKMNWKITRDHLLFGTGPAGYAVYYMTFFPTDAMATHNNYIDILAQTGVVGMFFCLWFFVKLVVVGYKLCRRLKGRGDFPEAMANISLAGTVACIIIMAFGDWLFPFAYTQTIEGYNYSLYNWLFMGAIVVLDRLFPGSRLEKNA